MNIIRIFGYRRLFHAFKKPPPMYKRQVVPSDFDVSKLNSFYDSDNIKKNPEKYSGKQLYKPKYGSSLYDHKVYEEYKEKK